LASPPLKIRDRRDKAVSGVIRTMKWLRAWPVLNVPATTVCRTTLGLLGRDPSFFARHLPRSGLVTARLPDNQVLRLWSRGDDNIASPVFWSGYSAIEPETCTVFYDLAKRARTTLDIGAHVGFYAILASHANRSGRVLAFEPLPTAHERLLRNVSLNAVTNISCFRLAAGSQDTTTEFFHVESSDAIPSSSSLSRIFMETELPQYKICSQSVEVIRIDEFVREHGLRDIDLVKIDTESTEDDVLEGMQETLRRDRPTVICELLPGGPAEAIDAVMKPLGYKYFHLSPGGMQPCSRLIPDPVWRNFLFAPE
jgi:FkbM family methyltransferase